MWNRDGQLWDNIAMEKTFKIEEWFIWAAIGLGCPGYLKHP